MASISTNTKTSMPASLFDRLTETSPSQRSQATAERGELPIADLESAIYRDLCWLVQSTRFDCTSNLSRWPNVQRSVLNYGIDVFAGKITNNPDLPQIEASIKRSIECYEPRLQKGTLVVQATQGNSNLDHREIHVQIYGTFVHVQQAIPIALQLFIDTDTGRVELKS